SGLIRDHPQTSQHTHRQKTDIFRKWLILIESFGEMRQGHWEGQILCLFSRRAGRRPFHTSLQMT
ncbi:hypothetical protein ACQZ6H_20290, partial [Agrobacterium fabrum]